MGLFQKGIQRVKIAPDRSEERSAGNWKIDDPLQLSRQSRTCTRQMLGRVASSDIAVVIAWICLTDLTLRADFR